MELKPPDRTRQIHMHFYNPPVWFEVSSAFKGCSNKCSISVGEGLDYYDKDVVIFFGPHLNGQPVEKRQGQIWVLNGREPPSHYNFQISEWMGLFNWTMTYRRDSDIPNMRGHFEKRFNSSARLPNVTSKLTGRKENVSSTAWFVSNCHTESKREDYVKILKNKHSVDIFGRCGKNQCRPRNSIQCLSLLGQRYKFYLSFENSLCRDYISEKSFQFYTEGIDAIPITRGFNGMYSLYLPPESFIDTSNYDSIDKLVTFLDYLSKHGTLYEQYFQWRKYYQAEFDRYQQFCDLCERMHEPDVYTKYHRVYHDINNWVFGSSDVAMCTKVNDIETNSSSNGTSKLMYKFFPEIPNVKRRKSLFR
ncbi:alpha-(1,3)-fucosyltransferase C-like [Ylistrum balloti]|uniref:alpha-(1,3)-fucosyltransferase C-like n=1 Tax=Ylistrum balloti TaxID=509963 RepID=UPI002905B8F9|nr:alpha-(1,3)-fucosyltransferase C-like [Ylistrum balloti]